MENYETVLLVISQCFVYQIPPLIRSEGHRASNWNVENFLWKGRLRICNINEQLTIKLEDSITGDLFAACPYDDKGLAVEQVLDSSRYFVIRVEDQGRHAYLGLGFEDRSEAFDFNVTLQDFIRHKTNETEDKALNLPAVDYSLKEGQTISLNLSGKLAKGKPSTTNNEGFCNDNTSNFIIPPPPKSTVVKPNTNNNTNEDFGNFQEADENENDLKQDSFEGWAKF
ncbi:adaptin ear-binding coat-associated protein 1 NECAP-1 [Neoconidiobolus thromboides FSU 785]|nr:adaptin ear-binding coat-associated protein 1 NECAP-1 [Neoconidiobolus thromboides FSU 785]